MGVGGGSLRVRSVRPMQIAPRMVVGEEFSAAISETINSVDLPAVLLAKSKADELLDEFASVFPIVFVGALLVGLGYQYVKNTIRREELDINFPELPEGSGTIFLYGRVRAWRCVLPCAGAGTPGGALGLG